MTKSLHIKVIAGMAIVFAILALAVQPAFAQSQQAVCEGVAAAGANCGGGDTALNNAIRAVIQIISSIIGVLAVIMILIAGYKYVTSNGDSANVKSAKDTLFYAIVGILVVALAQAIVRFVLDKAT